jgi:hypothetical protein
VKSLVSQKLQRNIESSVPWLDWLQRSRSRSRSRRCRCTRLNFAAWRKGKSTRRDISRLKFEVDAAELRGLNEATMWHFKHQKFHCLSPIFHQRHRTGQAQVFHKFEEFSRISRLLHLEPDSYPPPPFFATYPPSQPIPSVPNRPPPRSPRAPQPSLLQRSAPPFDSQIISEFPENFAEFQKKQISLLWRRRRDGFKAETFHWRCDGHANTLTVILDIHKKKNIFGGFTRVKWGFRTPNSEWDGSNCMKIIFDPFTIQFRSDPNGFIGFRQTSPYLKIEDRLRSGQ